MVALAGSMSSGFCLEYLPVAVDPAGFDFDTVVENSATNQGSPNAFTGVSQTLDGSGSVFYENGLSGSQSGTGLPQNNQITASAGGNNYTFNLASYGNGTSLTSNTLQIAPDEGLPNTLTLNTPASFYSLAFLGFSTEAGGSDAIGQVVITFTDNSTTLYTNVLDYPDWYSTSNVGIFNSQGRIQNTSGLYNQYLSVPLTSGDGGRLYVSLLNLTLADQAKLVKSLTFTITSSASTDRSYVMSVAGAVPEPTSAMLLIAGSMALLFSNRRRQS